MNRDILSCSNVANRDVFFPRLMLRIVTFFFPVRNGPLNGLTGAHRTPLQFFRMYLAENGVNVRLLKKKRTLTSNQLILGRYWVDLVEICEILL